MTAALLVVALCAVQVVYLVSIGVTLWFTTRPVDRVDRSAPVPADLPEIVMLYPVLNEPLETMRTTLTAMQRAPYPRELLRVIAIPNENDPLTIGFLSRLVEEFDFLELMPVPSTSHRSWDAVWRAWDENPKAYWWHEGRRAGVRALPAKKTRQLIWALYNTVPDDEGALLSYIDADSVIPEDFWRTAAIGMQTYDVLQSTNINGNPLSSWPASFFAMDHISWDSTLYRHMSAGGRHPYWMLGKGLVFRFRDLLELGGFHPWVTIEDPEVGMRMWTNGRRLGIVESPLIEEVPVTWRQGILQRKRWVAGFFQSLGRPLVQMGMTPAARLRARLNFVPCLFLVVNPLGWAVGVAALVAVALTGGRVLSAPVAVLCGATLLLALALLLIRWADAWRYSRPVLPDRRQRLRFVLRVNPVLLLGYWLWWTVPLVLGFAMWRRDTGLTWERTEKRDANHELVRRTARPATERLASSAATAASPWRPRG